MTLLTQREVAEALRLSVRTIERMRVTGNGPTRQHGERLAPYCAELHAPLRTRLREH
jgi:hypothetical protein